MIKKILSIIVVSLLMTVNSYAAEFFKYKTVVGCGPKILFNSDDVPGYEAWQYYYIHIAETGSVVIYNDEYQYATYEKKKYSQLWNQNHKITSSKLTKDEITNVYQLEMISEYDPSYSNDHKKMIQFFNLNVESMTFVSRSVGYPSRKKYEATTGICWKIL